MAFESIAAAQDCREYLGIKGNTYVTVNGYVDGNPHNVTIYQTTTKLYLVLSPQSVVISILIRAFKKWSGTKKNAP